MQEQSLMTAPQIACSAEDMRVDRQEVVLMLHDFSSRTPDELLAGPTKSAAFRARCRQAGAHGTSPQPARRSLAGRKGDDRSS
jgi:hypothetical protein